MVFITLRRRVLLTNGSEDAFTASVHDDERPNIVLYTKRSVALGDRQALYYYVDAILYYIYLYTLSRYIHIPQRGFFFRKVSGIFRNRSGNVNPRILNVNRVT